MSSFFRVTIEQLRDTAFLVRYLMPVSSDMLSSTSVFSLFKFVSFLVHCRAELYLRGSTDHATERMELQVCRVHTQQIKELFFVNCDSTVMRFKIDILDGCY